MQIAVIHLTKSIIDDSLMLAIKNTGMFPVPHSMLDFHLSDFNGFILIGDFISELERPHFLASFSATLQALKNENHKGKPILGFGAGAQCLIESGIIPGVTDNQLSIGIELQSSDCSGLTEVSLTEHYQLNAFTRHIKPKTTLPITLSQTANFIIPPVLKTEMQNNGQILFHTDQKPMAITNKSGNALAVLSVITQLESLLSSMRDHIAAQKHSLVLPLYYLPRYEKTVPFQHSSQSSEIIMPIVEDNFLSDLTERLSISIQRYHYWEIADSSDRIASKKINSVNLDRTKSQYLLVMPHSPDVTIIRKFQEANGITNVEKIQHGIIWQFEPASTKAIRYLLNSHILYNPYTHKSYIY